MRKLFEVDYTVIYLQLTLLFRLMPTLGKLRCLFFHQLGMAFGSNCDSFIQACCAYLFVNKRILLS